MIAALDRLEMESGYTMSMSGKRIRIYPKPKNKMEDRKND